MDKFTVIIIAFLHNWKIVSTSLKTTTISLILLVILSGCSGITYPQSVPHITSTYEPSFLRISDKNVSELGLIREWTLHSVLTTAWSIDSNLFAVIGTENNDNHFGVYGYSTAALERLWFHETSAPLPVSLAFSTDNQAIAIPFWGYYLIDRDSGEVISEIE